MSWPEFSEKLIAENGGTEVFQATLVKGPSSGVALRLFLHVNDEFYPELFARAEELTISLSTGAPLTFEEFMQLGEAYWEDFAERGRKKRAAAGIEE